MWSSGLFAADAAKYTIVNRYLIGLSQYISETAVLDPSANCDEILLYWYGGGAGKRSHLSMCSKISIQANC